MNIYDKAHELANLLKDCEELRQFKEAKEKVEKKDITKKMLDDYRQIQFKAYSEQVEKGKIQEETMEKLKNLGSVISMNPDVSTYLQQEARFATLWEDIIKILSDAVDIDFSLDNSNQ